MTKTKPALALGLIALFPLAGLCGPTTAERLIAAAKNTPAYRDVFLEPDPLKALLNEIRDLANTPGWNPPDWNLQAALNGLKSSPYSLKSTFALIRSVREMKTAAINSGEATRAARLAAIENKLTLHFDALCQLSDQELNRASPPVAGAAAPPAGNPVAPPITKDTFSRFAPDSKIIVTLTNGRVLKGTFIGLSSQGRDNFWIKEPDEFTSRQIDFKDVQKVEPSP